MRRLCLMMVVGALFALPGWAQQGDDQATKAKKSSDDSAAATPATSDSKAAPDA